MEELLTEDVRIHYDEFSRLLSQRRQSILGRHDVDRAHFGEQVLDSPGDVGDLSVIDMSADYFLQLEDRHRKELEDISDAIERMNRGAYGLCDRCSESIGLARLRSLPYARLCVNCQHSMEIRTTTSRPAKGFL